MRLVDSPASRDRPSMDNDNPYTAPSPTAESSDQLLAFGYPRRHMRFWKIEQLKAEMRAQPLSERESLPYVVLYVALMNVAVGIPHASYNVLDTIDTVLSVAAAIVGTIFVYRQNGGIDGQYFLQRYFAIGFVVAVRCIAAVIVVMIPLMAVLDSVGMMSDQTNAFDLLVTLAIEFIIYWRIGHHVSDLARSTSPSTAWEGNMS